MFLKFENFEPIKLCPRNLKLHKHVKLCCSQLFNSFFRLILPTTNKAKILDPKNLNNKTSISSYKDKEKNKQILLF